MFPLREAFENYFHFYTPPCLHLSIRTFQNPSKYKKPPAIRRLIAFFHGLYQRGDREVQRYHRNYQCNSLKKRKGHYGIKKIDKHD